MTNKELAIKLAQTLDARKAGAISIIDVAQVTGFADYFVICTGNSATHVRALADEAEFKLKHEDNITPDHVEGHQTKSWVVLDYLGVVCHVFDREARDYYDLERLWADGKKIPEEEWKILPKD